jgi:hypothetical protein
MAKKTATLDWCVVRLGEDSNWWVDEISDDVHWDVDNLSIIDPRQIDYLIEATEPLKDYGFDQDLIEQAFIPFRIEKDLGNGRIRLVRVKTTLLDSDEKLFGLPDIVDEENGPYADFLDHVMRARVKMLNDIKEFTEKLTVDEVEEQIREEQNNLFMEGRSIHLFNEIAAVVDYLPAGWDDDDESEKKKPAEDDAVDDGFQLDDEEEEKLKNDTSLRWDEDDGENDEEEDEPPPGPPDLDDEYTTWDEDDGPDDEDEKPSKPKKTPDSKVSKTGSKVTKSAAKSAKKEPAKPAAKNAPKSRKK